MISHKWLPLIIFLVLSVSHNPIAKERMLDSIPVNPCSVTNDVFEPGESITYKVFYNWNFIWIAAGEVKFEVKDKGDQYHLSAVGRTFGSYDWIFKVRDYYDSYTKKSDLKPEMTIRKVLEGKYTQFDKTNYLHHQSKAISIKGKTEETANEEEIALADCTHDILSSIYMMRNIDFASMPTESKVPMHIYIDREVYPLTIVYKGTDERKRVKGLGLCSTLFFEPELVVGNIFKKDKGMKIWVSNDQNRIPLMIESPISVGSVKAVLKKYKGLKYPAAF